MSTAEEAQSVSGMEEAEALLCELEAASRLMARLAAAKGVLPAQHRLRADQMSRNMKALHESSLRRIRSVRTEEA